jgi:hypothetical protein
MKRGVSLEDSEKQTWQIGEFGKTNSVGKVMINASPLIRYGQNV